MISTAELVAVMQAPSVGSWAKPLLLLIADILGWKTTFSSKLDRELSKKLCHNLYQLPMSKGWKTSPSISCKVAPRLIWCRRPRGWECVITAAVWLLFQTWTKRPRRKSRICSSPTTEHYSLLIQGAVSPRSLAARGLALAIRSHTVNETSESINSARGLEQTEWLN